MDQDGLSANQLALLRDALGEGGLAGGGKLAEGLLLGSADLPPAAPGCANLTGSIRQSTAIGAAVYRSAVQTIPTTTWTTLSFSAAYYNTDNTWAVASPTLLRVRTPGLYIVTAFLDYVPNATGVRYLEIAYNATSAGYVSISATPAGFGAGLSHSVLISLVENDYLYVRTFQNSGGDLNVAAYARFSMARIP